MEDKRIEEMLRECWTPEEPEGMKARALRQSRQEFGRQHTRRLINSRWKLALTCAGILIVLATSISDHARQNRLSAMTGTGMSTPILNDKNIAKKMLEMNKFLAGAQSDIYPPDYIRMDDSL